MKKTVVVSLICLALVVLLGRQASAQASTDKTFLVKGGPVHMDPSVEAALANLAPGDNLTVVVTLRQQADLTLVHGADHAARLEGVIRALQATANATQGRLIGLLKTYQSQGLLSDFRPLWVFNGFSVTARQAVIETLAQDPDVYAIAPDAMQIVPAAGTAETNISLINAPALWAAGDSGQGVVVANMDSGVDATHPDLSARWRGGANSWFDPYGQHTTPVDLTGHGTGTMGIMVGGDAGGTAIGVAPGALWVAVKIFNDQGSATATAIHEGFQWLLDPDGDPATADAPQVVNNSWTYANPGCYLDFEPDLESLRAAGILPVFAAGNGGPGSSSDYSPANNPAAFAVGAIDNNSQLYAYSSRGPATCGGASGPFPDLVAPGVNIVTAGLFGTYQTDSGTSFAAPHVAGGLALLLAAYPNLDAGTQEQALIQSAVDLGPAGPDDDFGYGRLDLLAASNWASTAPTPTATATPTSLPSPTPTPTTLPNVNLALHQPVTVSSFQDAAHDGAMAADGDPATQWQTEKVKGKNKTTTEWIDVDLGAVQDVSQVILRWDGYFATDYALEVSGDGTTWATVFSTASGNGGQDTVSFNTVQARYVRLNTSAWSNNAYRNWLNELEVYASGAAPAPTPTATAIPTATATATATATPGSNSSTHVGDLDDASSGNGGHWTAAVIVTVHDAAEMPLPGVVVSGSWSNGASGSGNCTTAADGTCAISRNNLKNNAGSVTFAVTDLSFGGWPYQANANHDPDGDSDGSVIALSKP